jgi:Raf kinase inhibitor-like YbhB/YbcL family protein
MAFVLNSPAFADGQAIPAKYTCDGENVSPALTWTGFPAGAAALALVVDDPDAPNGTFTHWVVVDIDPSTTGSAEGQPPPGGREITNDTGKASYFGPCPPSGRHHYRFTLYALRTRIGSGPTTKQAALDAIRAAATAQARVVGTFHR